MLATTEIQTWLYSTLNGSVSASVRDFVDDNATFPQVTIGEAITGPFRTHSRDGESLLQRIHIWSRAKGFKEAQALAEAVTALIDTKTVSTASFHGFAVRERSQSLRDPDGITRHIVLEYRFYAHATA